MAYLNDVKIIGNLVSDPRVRDLPNGGKVASFTLASNRKYKNADEQEQEETLFVDAEIFGNRANVLETYAKKGRQLLIEGRLKQDRWKDKESGENRQKILVHVKNFQFLGQNKDNNSDVSNEKDETDNTKAKGKKKIPF